MQVARNPGPFAAVWRGADLRPREGAAAEPFSVPGCLRGPVPAVSRCSPPDQMHQLLTGRQSGCTAKLLQLLYVHISSCCSQTQLSAMLCAASNVALKVQLISYMKQAALLWRPS